MLEYGLVETSVDDFGFQTKNGGRFFDNQQKSMKEVTTFNGQYRRLRILRKPYVPIKRSIRLGFTILFHSDIKPKNRPIHQQQKMQRTLCSALHR